MFGATVPSYGARDRGVHGLSEVPWAKTNSIIYISIYIWPIAMSTYLCFKCIIHLNNRVFD